MTALQARRKMTGANMQQRTFTEQLTDLRPGPYAGQGGVFALSHDLGVHVNTLKSWRNGSREPNYRHRQAIAKLWQEKCGGAA